MQWFTVWIAKEPGLESKNFFFNIENISTTLRARKNLNTFLKSASKALSDAHNNLFHLKFAVEAQTMCLFALRDSA